MVQNKQRGTAFQAIFLFFPTKQLCQLRNVALIKEMQHPYHSTQGEDQLP